MKKKSLIVSSFMSLGALGVQAQTAAPAPAPEPPFPLTANINLTTKYKFRGQDQGNTKFFSPALQGGFDWSANGFYLGNWNSNIGFTNSGLEMDFYGGYKGAITPDLGYDVGVLQYYYPQKDKSANFDTTELYGALSYSWLTLKYSHTISKDYFGIGELQQQAAAGDGVSINRPKGRGTGYIELNANVPIVDKLTLNAHIGYTRLNKKLRDANYSFSAGEGTTDVDVGVPSFYDYKVGVTYDMSAALGSGVSAAAAIVGANKKGFYGDLNKARVIFTISKAM